MAASSGSVYRDCRRAFIAACDAAHVDPIARLHPARDADGKPLFMDSAALGPRLASRAMLVIGADTAGLAIMVDLLKEAPSLPEDTKLVLIHALDPAAFAGLGTEPTWAAAMLEAVATEDLSRVRQLAVLALLTDFRNLERSLAAALPKAAVQILSPAASLDDVKAAIACFSRR